MSWVRRNVLTWLKTYLGPHKAVFIRTHTHRKTQWTYIFGNKLSGKWLYLTFIWVWDSKPSLKPRFPSNSTSVIFFVVLKEVRNQKSPPSIQQWTWKPLWLDEHLQIKMLLMTRWKLMRDSDSARRRRPFPLCSKTALHLRDVRITFLPIKQFYSATPRWESGTFVMSPVNPCYKPFFSLWHGIVPCTSSLSVWQICYKTKTTL